MRVRTCSYLFPLRISLKCAVCYWLQVYLGGGLKQFVPNNKKNISFGEAGLRNDGRNLIDEWVSERCNDGKAVYVDNKVHE